MLSHLLALDMMSKTTALPSEHPCKPFAESGSRKYSSDLQGVSGGVWPGQASHVTLPGLHHVAVHELLRGLQQRGWPC